MCQEFFFIRIVSDSDIIQKQFLKKMLSTRAMLDFRNKIIRILPQENTQMHVGIHILSGITRIIQKFYKINSTFSFES